jgi:NhaP-type Na+/H+ or K+/H+ antiporter
MRFRAMVSAVVLGALLIGGTAMPALAEGRRRDPHRSLQRAQRLEAQAQ